MEEQQMTVSLPAIKVQFGKYPLLQTLVKSPTRCLQSPLSQLVSQRLHSQLGTRDDKDFYRIVFSPGASGELMTIQRGPLAGLQTTSVVENGRISSIAGLEKVDDKIARNMMPILLAMGALNSINNRLDHITDICVDIRNHQIHADKAKLERISEVIIDCFESMSEGNPRLNRENLIRVTRNTDDCFEILCAFLDDLKSDHKKRPMDHRSFDEKTRIQNSGKQQCDRPSAVIRQLMQHPVFSAYERYVAGHACQALLLGDYSQSSIGRRKRSLERACDSIRKVFKERIEPYNRGAEYFSQIADDVYQGIEHNGWTVKDARDCLDIQLDAIKQLQSELYKLLDARIDDFDALSKFGKNVKLEIFVIDGVMIFSEDDSLARESEEPLSIEKAPIYEQIERGHEDT